MTHPPSLDVVELKAVPIFRAGSYPQGQFDETFVQGLADRYDPAFHEAPNVLAHTEGEQPSSLAFGWVRRLFVKGQTLFADFVNVPRAFAELVLAGRIKKRSVEIYDDLAGRGPYLRAVAWPPVPQVKGLADVHPTQVFTDAAEFTRIDFQEKENSMSQTQEQGTHDFPTRRELEQMIERLTAELRAEQRRILAAHEIANFCEQMVLAGRMTPAERESEEPLLIEQRQRETAAESTDGQPRPSDRRMEFYRSRRGVVTLETDDAAHRAGKPDPAAAKAARQFHEHREFFTRMGVSLEDLAELQRIEGDAANPLTV